MKYPSQKILWILKSIRTRIIRLFTELIPFNLSKYMPRDYADSSTFDSTYTGIESSHHEEFLNELYIPIDLYENTAQFMRLDKYNKSTLKASSNISVGAVSVPSGRVYSNSPLLVVPLDANGVVLTDVIFHHLQSEFNTDYHLPIRFFPNPIKIEGTVASLLAGGGSGTNIGHWMLDVLPRIKQMEKLLPINKIDRFLVPGNETQYKTNTLKQLGISREKLIFVEPQIVHFKASTMLFSTPPRSHNKTLVPKWIIDFHRCNFLVNADIRNSNYPNKIYLSREDSKLRGLKNEPEVVNYLSSKGYKKIILTHYDYMEKIKVVHNAKEIVSLTGAGLTFLLYCQPGANVLEIFPRSFVHYVNYCIAMRCNLNYEYLIVDSGLTSNSSRDAQRDSITIDIDELESSLKHFQ